MTARVQAELNQSKSQLNSLTSLKSSANKLQQKMLLKDEEIKKSYGAISSLKDTMRDLEEGIQIYQEMAE